MYLNGLGTAVNLPQALESMHTAATHGHALAQHGLGFMYFEGQGVAPAGAQALHCFTLAAAQGMLGSQMTLAMMYEAGRLLVADPAAAAYWKQRARRCQQQQ